MNFQIGVFRLVFLGLTMLAGVAGNAQSSNYVPPNKKTEVFGGFSSIGMKPGRVDGQDLSGVRLNGWTATYTTYQFFRRWGLTAEFSGNYGNPEIDAPVAGASPRVFLRARNHAFLFGGTYRSFERRRLALTGRILAGATHWSPEADSGNGDGMALLSLSGIAARQTAFTFGFGQSVDWKISEGVAIRVQPDLRFVRMEDPGGERRTRIQLPFSVGLVYKFGNR